MDRRAQVGERPQLKVAGVDKIARDRDFRITGSILSSRIVPVICTAQYSRRLDRALGRGVPETGKQSTSK